MLLIDTSFIIDLINGDPNAVEKAIDLDQQQIPVYISSVAVEEYLRGIYYLFSENEEILLRKLFEAESDLARFQTIDFDYQIAKVAARVDANLMIRGEQISTADVLIGATALFHNYKLLTRDTKHFERIENLQIELY